MLSPVLSRCLAAGRAAFNARVAEMRTRQPGLDTQAFAAFLADALDPLAQAVDAHDPERSMAFVDEAFDVALTLVAHSLAGPAARLPWVGALWRQVLPHYVGLLAQAPTPVLGSLSNAVVQLGAVDGVRLPDWLAAMQAHAGQVQDVAQLRGVAQVQAWRAGMAQYRTSALQVAATLPEPLRLALLQAAPGRTWAQVLGDHHASPWWHEAHGAPAQASVAVGAFTGFGGAFTEPPQVRAQADGFVVRSGERHLWLTADAHGAVLLPATAAEFAAAGPGVHAGVRLDGDRLLAGTRVVPLDVPTEGLALASNAHTAAITSPYTHGVLLVPLAA